MKSRVSEGPGPTDSPRRMKKRYRIKINGIVQGVGFRPTVYRYAKKNNLCGFVFNSSEGVVIEVEGDEKNIWEFLKEIKKNPPERARIKSIWKREIPVKGENNFRIIQSLKSKKIEIEISPDIATCRDCLSELLNPDDRRYLFPFINCTNCGPRFTIIKDIPYDRKNTTMADFSMCEKCRQEYNNPEDRRYHAQPNCCFECGPEIQLIDKNGKVVAEEVRGIEKAALFIEKGKVVAIKGLGGYHLSCNGLDKKAVKSLRERKKRIDKPFALMAKDIKTIKEYCSLNEHEKKILLSWRAPIVLLKKKNEKIPFSVAPYNNYLGFMLPYSPLHHLLFHLNKNLKVIVMTSGNLSEEPIAYKDEEAFEKLEGIFDFFLTHNRKIYINCDDSVLRIFKKKTYFIRRSRGFVPEGIEFPYKFKKNIFAAGADMKNTFALAKDKKVYLSQHIGDLQNTSSINSYKKSINLLKKTLKIEPEIITYDMHPDYFSTKIAKEMIDKKRDIKGIAIQHHHAHIASVMAENKIKNEKVIGVAFDGTGFGTDKKIWGGEFLICDYSRFERTGHLEYVPLPGGEKAIKDVWKMGCVYLYKTFGKNFLSLDIDFTRKIDVKKWELIEKMIEKGINCPLTSSMGRLFDAVSAICNIRREINYEGQAAIEMEMKIEETKAKPYNYRIRKEKGLYLINVDKMIEEIVYDLVKRKKEGFVSFRFHITISDIIRKIVNTLRDERKINKVALGGGVFQNFFLLDKVYSQLKKDGFEVLLHREVPTNDGGISLGQVAIANFLQIRR